MRAAFGGDPDPDHGDGPVGRRRPPSSRLLRFAPGQGPVPQPPSSTAAQRRPTRHCLSNAKRTRRSERRLGRLQRARKRAWRRCALCRRRPWCRCAARPSGFGPSQGRPYHRRPGMRPCLDVPVLTGWNAGEGADLPGKTLVSPVSRTEFEAQKKSFDAGREGRAGALSVQRRRQCRRPCRRP